MTIFQHMTPEQREAFITEAENCKLDLTDMNYGSTTLLAKMWFLAGWEAAETLRDKEELQRTEEAKQRFADDIAKAIQNSKESKYTQGCPE